MFNSFGVLKARFYLFRVPYKESQQLNFKKALQNIQFCKAFFFFH
jgi:hypothetical protein